MRLSTKLTRANKEALLKKLMELKPVFEIAVNPFESYAESRKSWLISPEGIQFNKEIENFNSNLKLLIESQSAEKQFKEASFGESHLLPDRTYNWNAKHGLLEDYPDNTELFSLFLDDYPSIATFLQQELLQNSSLNQANTALQAFIENRNQIKINQSNYETKVEKLRRKAQVKEEEFLIAVEQYASSPASISTIESRTCAMILTYVYAHLDSDPNLLIKTRAPQDHTLLTAAIKKQDWALFNTLINIPEFANAPGKEGFTPLMWATLQGNERMALKLLEVTSIDVNASTEQGNTALSLAIKEGHPLIAACIIRKGAHYNPDELCKTLENHIAELESQETNLEVIDKLINLKTIFYMFAFKMPLLDASYWSKSLYQNQRDKWVTDNPESPQWFSHLQRQLEGKLHLSSTELGAKDKPKVEFIPGDLHNPDRKRDSEHSELPQLRIIVPSSATSSAISTPVPVSIENESNTPDKYAERLYIHPLVDLSGLYTPRNYSYISYKEPVDPPTLQSSSSTTAKVPEPLPLRARDKPPSYSSNMASPPPYRYSTSTPRVSFSGISEGMLSPPPSYSSSSNSPLGTPIATPSKLSGLTSSEEQPPTVPGFSSFGESTTPTVPGFSSFGASTTPTVPEFISFGASTTPTVPGFISFGEPGNSSLPPMQFPVLVRPPSPGPKITDSNESPSSTPGISSLEEITNAETSEASLASPSQKVSYVPTGFFGKDKMLRSKSPIPLPEIPENEQEEQEEQSNEMKRI